VTMAARGAVSLANPQSSPVGRNEIGGTDCIGISGVLLEKNEAMAKKIQVIDALWSALDAGANGLYGAKDRGA
jgi:hypothetical protein